MSEPRVKGMTGVCFDIDGEWWHEPGSCEFCRDASEEAMSDITRGEIARLLSESAELHDLTLTLVEAQQLRGICRLALRALDMEAQTCDSCQSQSDDRGMKFCDKFGQYCASLGNRCGAWAKAAPKGE